MFFVLSLWLQPLFICTISYGWYEKGERVPSCQSVCYIAQTFYCNIDFLYGISDQMETDYVIVSSLGTPKLYALVTLTKENPGIEDRLLSYAELANIIYISLDTFHSIVQNVSTELDAWLTFLSCTEASRILDLIQKFPEFLELYKDMALYRTNPKELIFMFSEALYILDHNTEKYMIEEQNREIQAQKKIIAENKKQIAENKKHWRSRFAGFRAKLYHGKKIFILFSKYKSKYKSAGIASKMTIPFIL